MHRSLRGTGPSPLAVRPLSYGARLCLLAAAALLGCSGRENARPEGEPERPAAPQKARPVSAACDARVRLWRERFASCTGGPRFDEHGNRLSLPVVQSSVEPTADGDTVYLLRDRVAWNHEVLSGADVAPALRRRWEAGLAESGRSPQDAPPAVLLAADGSRVLADAMALLDRALPRARLRLVARTPRQGKLSLPEPARMRGASAMNGEDYANRLVFPLFGALSQQCAPMAEATDAFAMGSAMGAGGAGALLRAARQCNCELDLDALEYFSLRECGALDDTAVAFELPRDADGHLLSPALRTLATVQDLATALASAPP